MLALEDRRARIYLIVGLALSAMVALLYVTSIREAVGMERATQITDVFNILVAFAGMALCFRLALSFRKGEVLRTIWLLLGVGLFLWGLGEALYAWTDIVLQGEGSPISSLGDIPWILGYVPLTAGLVLRFRSLQTEPERRWLIALLVGYLAILIAVSIFVLAPILQDTETDLGGRIIGILYPIGDLALALAAALSVLVLAGGRLSESWTIIAAGFAINAASDLLYTLAVWQGTYISGAEGTNLISSLADVSYSVSYVVLLFGIILQARVQKVL